MTPAIKIAEANGVKYVLHEYEHHPEAESYGVEAAEALGIRADRVYKTLIVMLDEKSKRMAAGVVPVSRQLDLKALAKAADVKRAFLAPVKEVERATGYVPGGISPLGQKTKLQMIIDKTILGLETVYVSAGKRGLQMEMAPRDLVELTSAQMASISR